MSDFFSDVVVDSFKFLPRSFRPLYEGRGPLRGEEDPVWTPFGKRLSEARIALISSAGLYLKASQDPYDTERERSHPEWGDPTWRAIPASAEPGDCGVAHLHINDEDLIADPEVALPMRGLEQLVEEGMIGGTVAQHVTVMGYQDRELRHWRETTAAEITSYLREEGADGVVLAPA
ncbi:MAG TPA: glycine/sarcosine/betaine reductase selenoprotein B family protein [Candidatus Dormibacteraeota bacterium]